MRVLAIVLLCFCTKKKIYIKFCFRYLLSLLHHTRNVTVAQNICLSYKFCSSSFCEQTNAFAIVSDSRWTNLPNHFFLSLYFISIYFTKKLVCCLPAFLVDFALVCACLYSLACLRLYCTCKCLKMTYIHACACRPNVRCDACMHVLL